MHPEDPWMEVTTISRGRASQAAASFDDTPDFDAPERTEAEEQARLSKIKPDPIVVAYMGYHLLRLNSHGAPSVLSSDGFDTPVQREMDIEKKAMAAFKQEAFGPDANPKVIVYMDELVDNLVALAEKIEQGVSTLRERGAKPTQEQQDLAARYKARAAAVREFMKSKGEKFGTPDIAKELHFPFTRWNEYDVEGEEEISMKQKDAPKAAAAGAEAAAAAPAAGEDLPGDNFQANAKYSVFTGDYYDSAPERALEDTELATIISERVQDAKAAEKIATYLIEKHKVVTNTAVNKLTAAQLAEAGMEKVSSDEFLLDVKSLGPPLEDPAPAEGKKADEL